MWAYADDVFSVPSLVLIYMKHDDRSPVIFVGWNSINSARTQMIVLCWGEIVCRPCVVSVVGAIC